MFGKKAHTSIKTLIAHGTRIRGDMEFEDGLRVDGEVHGAISAQAGDRSMLVVSEGAVVEGGVRADHVIINGTVRGPVEALGVLELQAKARIEGDVHYASLQMTQGATILGQLRPLEQGSEDAKKVVVKLAAAGA